MVEIESYSLKNCVWALVREFQAEKRERECFILYVNMPTTGAFYSNSASSFVQGIYHDFPHSTLTHWCSVRISTDICVWWEALGLTGLTEATPITPMSWNITSRFPAGFRPVSLQVRVLSHSCSSRQDLIELTKAVKWRENENTDHIGRLQPLFMLRKWWCQKSVTRYYKTG